MIAVTGGDQLAALGMKLRVAGDAGRGLRKRVRRNIVAAVTPMRDAVKSNALAIPAKGPRSTGLRRRIAKATKIVVRPGSGANAVVRLWVNPALMGDYPELAALMEGEKSPWRHPYFGNREVWADQAAHPYFKPAVEPRLPLVRVAVIAAVVETTDAIAL